MITHTPKPMITSSGFIPDDDTRRNDEAHAQQMARIAEEQAAMERDARRYRALRAENINLGCAGSWLTGDVLDAAADRLLDGE